MNCSGDLKSPPPVMMQAVREKEGIMSRRDETHPIKWLITDRSVQDGLNKSLLLRKKIYMSPALILPSDSSDPLNYSITLHAFLCLFSISVVDVKHVLHCAAPVGFYGGISDLSCGLGKAEGSKRKLEPYTVFQR